MRLALALSLLAAAALAAAGCGAAEPGALVPAATAGEAPASAPAKSPGAAPAAGPRPLSLDGAEAARLMGADPPPKPRKAGPLSLDDPAAARLLGGDPAPKPRKAGPLSLDDPAAARLMGDDPGPARPASASRRRVADNTRCYVCHTNYDGEELSAKHAEADVGCERCHGPSDEHCGDEGNVTAPTIFFTKAQVAPGCKVCHPDDKVVDGGTYCLHILLNPAPDKVCTDCHGKHRMTVRTVRWMPGTREAVSVPAPAKAAP